MRIEMVADRGNESTTRWVISHPHKLSDKESAMVLSFVVGVLCGEDVVVLRKDKATGKFLKKDG